MPTTIKNKMKLLAAIKGLENGMPTYCATMSFTYKGQTYATPAVTSVCQQLETASQARITAEAAYHEAVINEDSLIEANYPLISTVRQTLGLSFATQPTVLSGLGLTARKKPAPLSAEALAAATAKAKATRQARGTAGKKAKAAIVGNVTGVVITPTTASSTAASATTTPPAANAAGGGVTLPTTAVLKS